MKSRIKIVNQPKRAIKDIEALAKQMRGPNLVKVGLPKGSNAYPDGTSVIMVGAVHEFGSPARNIPQRSYLRSTLVKNKIVYKRLFKKLSKQVTKGKISTKEALQLLGLQVQTDVRGVISDGLSPPLKTREGTPLIDTGHLRQSIVYKVEQ